MSAADSPVQRWWPLAGVLALAVGLAAAWRWSALGEWADVERLVEVTQGLSRHGLAPLYVLAAYVLAGLVMFPVTALIVATLAVFGPLPGGAYALAGATLSAATGYLCGRSLGRRWLARHSEGLLGRLRARLARAGVLTVAAVRLAPVAPFGLINLAAGAARVPFGAFVLGTALGLLPGVVALGAFIDRLLRALAQPDSLTIGLAAAVALLALLALVLLRRWVRRATDTAA